MKLHFSLRRLARFGAGCIALFSLPALLVVAPARAEVIRSFHADARLLKDASLDITETIVMDFEGAQKHGIFRVIPIRYKRLIGYHTLDLKLLSVTNQRAQPWKRTIFEQGNDINIRIGDARRLISGVQTYRIRYVVRRAVTFSKGVAEVNWNVTGNRWPFKIMRATVRFYPPPKVSVSKVAALCYVIRLTGSKRIVSVGGSNVFISYGYQPLAPGEGLTFVARLPKTSIKAS